MLVWTNPLQLPMDKNVGVIYLATIRDDTGAEYRYVGKTKYGERRMRRYQNNIRRVHAGLPRMTTPKQEAYRAVHFVLARAVELGWQYTLQPVENTTLEELHAVELRRIVELNGNLNGRRNWLITEYSTLNLKDFF